MRALSHAEVMHLGIKPYDTTITVTGTRPPPVSSGPPVSSPPVSSPPVSSPPGSSGGSVPTPPIYDGPYPANAENEFGMANGDVIALKGGSGQSTGVPQGTVTGQAQGPQGTSTAATTNKGQTSFSIGFNYGPVGGHLDFSLPSPDFNHILNDIEGVANRLANDFIRGVDRVLLGHNSIGNAKPSQSTLPQPNDDQYLQISQSVLNEVASDIASDFGGITGQVGFQPWIMQNTPTSSVSVVSTVSAASFMPAAGTDTTNLHDHTFQHLNHI